MRLGFGDGNAALSPFRLGAAAASSCGKVSPYRLDSCDLAHRLSPDSPAGLPAMVFQLDGGDPRYRWRLCLRRSGHQPLLSSLARPPRLSVSEMVRAHARNPGILLPAGHAGALGRGSSLPSSAR